MSFPKIPSARIGAMRENRRIIHYDACPAPPGRSSCRKPVQVARVPRAHFRKIPKTFFPASCTRLLTLLRLYPENLLSPSAVTRPLHGDVPTIDLVIGYNKSNMSALLKRFLSRVDEVVARVS